MHSAFKLSLAAASQQSGETHLHHVDMVVAQPIEGYLKPLQLMVP
jgi:hypothetical protein